MSEPGFNTTSLHYLVNRLQSGDVQAGGEIFQRVASRLEVLTRSMLRRFPSVSRFEGTDDVLQNALLRLLRALREIRPPSVRDFFRLAATQLRRELLDLARHYRGPQGAGANEVEGLRVAAAGDTGFHRVEPATPADADLERWQAFHEAVERLPAEEREVVGLVFYHGWTQAQIAELLGVDERTVRRRWQAICLQLHEVLGSDMPSS